MKFTHLIEINNLGNPMITPLSRSQLWHGLVLRAERPTLFLIGLDSCEVTSRSAEGMSRTLHFGKLEVIDEVRFKLLDQVHCFTPSVMAAETPANLARRAELAFRSGARRFCAFPLEFSQQVSLFTTQRPRLQ